MNDVINSFWDRIISILRSIDHTEPNIRKIREIDDEVSRLDDISWEYGPYDDNIFYFALSPDFDENKIDRVRTIINLAPKVPNWIFMAGKPAKKNCSSKVSIVSNTYEQIFDTSEWRCILYKFQDKTFEMDIYIPQQTGSIEDIHTILDIQLSNLIGELFFLEKIKNIQLITEGDDVNKGLIKLNDLSRDYLEGILNI